MTKFEEKVTKYTNRLMQDLSIQQHHAFGIWGNLGTETGGFVHLQELKPVVAGSRGGYGWMQWTGPRRKAYEAWAKERNLNVADDETNYRYLVHETLTKEHKSLDLLKKTTSVRAATETFMLKNLRPGVPHLDARLRWAYKAQAAYNKQKQEDIEVAQQKVEEKIPSVFMWLINLIAAIFKRK